MLDMVLVFISITWVFDAVEGKSQLPRTQNQCDILVATVYLRQVSPGTHLLLSQNRKGERLGRLGTTCPDQNLNPG